MNMIHYFFDVAIFTQMRDIWLYGNFAENNNMSLWSGSSEIYERNPDYHFKIQGNYGMVSIRTGRDFKWKLAVISSRDSEKPFVRFVHDDIPTHGICTDEFLMDSQEPSIWWPIIRANVFISKWKRRIDSFLWENMSLCDGQD